MRLHWEEDVMRRQYVLTARLDYEEARIHKLDPRSGILRSDPFRMEDLPRLLRALADKYEAEPIK